MHDTYLPSCWNCAARARKWTENAVKFDEIQTGNDAFASQPHVPVPRHFLNVKNCLRAPACYFIEFVPWHSRRNNNVTKKKERDRERERGKRETLEDDEMRHAYAVFQRIQEFSRIFEKNLNVTDRTNGHSHPCRSRISLLQLAKLCEKSYATNVFNSCMDTRSTRIDDTFAMFLRSFSLVRTTSVNRLRIFPKILSYCIIRDIFKHI